MEDTREVDTTITYSHCNACGVGKSFSGFDRLEKAQAFRDVHLAMCWNGRKKTNTINEGKVQ